MKILSKEELKNTNGGLTDGGGSGGGGGLSCSAGASCRVVVIENGETKNYYGNCNMSQAGSSITCYCNAGYEGMPLSSNGGMSRCWS